MLSSSSQLGRCECKADLGFLHPQLAAQLFYLLMRLLQVELQLLQGCSLLPTDMYLQNTKLDHPPHMLACCGACGAGVSYTHALPCQEHHGACQIIRPTAMDVQQTCSHWCRQREGVAFMHQPACVSGQSCNMQQHYHCSSASKFFVGYRCLQVFG